MADQNTHYDVLIIGQGASSYSAAMYAARYQMKPIIFGAIFGGETATGGGMMSIIALIVAVVALVAAGGGIVMGGRR